MISKNLEITALIVHILSFLGDTATIYFNNNIEVKFLCILNGCQHLLKIYRILVYGFALLNAPNWFCYLHGIINAFTNEASITTSCLIVFTLYIALIFPLFYSEHYRKKRPLILAFVVIYNLSYTIFILYEPLVVGYSAEYLAEAENCSSAYRNHLYQYVMGSPLFNLPFNILTIFCTGVINYKIIMVPRKSLKKQITTMVKMSFSRCVKILFYCFFLTLISFVNLIQDINNGINVRDGYFKEKEVIGVPYLLTASSGILILIFTNSLNQIKRKFGIRVKDDDSINDDEEYMLPHNKDDVNDINSITASHS
ncbi:hypothetical protein BCR32DRAFT_291683 [Anaeromyces robustus]|uniref:G-protein coupled receptors family 1 profile domain-containing protein n=1 Tax=Anaeromyces robustus TaxID=1754192 RepID=A0A1Y1XDY1_9FUNG|nr:hypothetical protein BCR32DRAFT_291683 [Anaeromyces robustus]|eukprot:ORX83935.1 hypothetical protein BCR32DRAFT_291683 [Anaeromyces robustus]